MWSLRFPREIATPARIGLFHTKEKYLDYINYAIRLKNLFTTVYNYRESKKEGYRESPVYGSAIIDRLYFDCDFKVKGVETDGYISMLKLHEWCKDNGNIKHQPYLTGTAYSVILAAKHNGLENKSGAVHNSCHYVAKKLDILTDMSVTDISRITRIPNTFNFKETAKRYVIPLKEDQLYLGDEAIREIAKKQQFGVKPIGDGAFDISKFDCVREYRNDLSMPEFDEKDIVDMDINLGRVPACIKRMLAEPELGYKARPILIIWLRDKGLLLQETISILKKTLSDRKFKHCVFEEKQPQKMYQRIMSMYMPRCDTIAGQGYCNCKSENECGLK